MKSDKLPSDTLTKENQSPTQELLLQSTLDNPVTTEIVAETDLNVSNRQEQHLSAAELPTTATPTLLENSENPLKNSAPRSARLRSTRILEHDPIIAPGFGTAKDLQRLAQQLSCGDGPVFTVEAIEHMMKAKGRGVTRSSSRVSSEGNRDEKEQSNAINDGVASAVGPNAWADFMKEEGMDDSANKDDSDGGGKKSSSRAEASSVPDSKSKKRAYQLEPLISARSPKSNAVSDQKGSKRKKSVSKDIAVEVTGQSGTLLQAGTLDSAIIGRGRLPKADALSDFLLVASCPVPTRILPDSIKIAKVFTSCNAVHFIATDVHGVAYGWGRNESNQLGQGFRTPNNQSHDDNELLNNKTITLPTRMDLPGRLKMAAMGKAHTLMLLQDGSLWSVGANKLGQCGVRTFTDVLSYRKCIVPDSMSGPWTQIACGEAFSVALDSNGYLYSTGSSEFGQLGNGETGEHFVAANKIAFANASTFTRRTTFCHAPTEKLHTNNDQAKVVSITGEDGDVRIQSIACGKNHVIALEAFSEHNPRLFSWGCGNYGCLGHGVQADEYFPRHVGALNNVLMTHCESNVSTVKIAAGAHCSLVQTPNGHVYYWGKHRSVGEAAMRPQLVDVLANNQHVVQHIAAGGQTVVCSTSTRQTIAWGQGPYGELGLGSAKSSSKPAFCEALNGCQLIDLACGYGNTLYVVKSDDAKEDKAVYMLPFVDAKSLEPFPPAEEAKSTKKKGKS